MFHFLNDHISFFFSTRLEAAESEIERLTGILRERDEHEKEQDGKISVLRNNTNASLNCQHYSSH